MSEGPDREPAAPPSRPAPPPMAFELRAPTSGAGILDPRTALLLWGAGSVVIGLFVTYFLAQGDLRSVFLVLLGLVALVCLATRRGVYILLVFLPFMYFTRRLVLNFQEFSSRDPILMFPPLTTTAMFMGFLIFNRMTVFYHHRRSALLKTISVFMFILALQIVNPLQGNIVVGLVGAMYFLVPMAWVYFGLALNRDDIDRIFRIVMVIGCITALYGLYQHTWGLSAFELYEMKAKNFLVGFGAGSEIRIMSTFASLGDFSLYLALASVIAFGRFWETKRRLVYLGLFCLFLYTMVWTAVRTSYIMVAFSILVLMILYGKEVNRVVVRGTLALLFVVLVYAGFSHYKPEKMYGRSFSSNPYVVHTLSGVTHPMQEGSFKARLTNWSDILRTSIWPYPAGRGLGSTTLAAARFGGAERIVDSYFFELFFSAGLLGPPVFILLMVMSVSTLIRMSLDHPEVQTYRITLALLCGAYLGSVFGLVPRDTTSGPFIWLLIGWTIREAVELRDRESAEETPPATLPEPLPAASGA